MAQGLPIEEIIDIQTSVQAGGTIRAEFGTGLLLTTSSKLAGSGSNKCIRFGSLTDVASFFGTADQVYEDAAVWFGADPAPRALYIGRWVASGDADTRVVSPALTGNNAVDIDDLKAVTTGGFTINGTEVGPINFSSITNLTTAAAALQTAIQAASITGLSSATVTFSDNRLTINADSPTHIDIGETTTSGRTNFIRTLYLTAEDGATFNQGSATEATPAVALTACVALSTDGPQTAIMLASDVPLTYGASNADTRLNVRSFAQGGDFMYAMLDTSTGALTPNETTSALASTAAASQSNVIPVYSRARQGLETTGPKPDIAIMAKLSSQNFDLPQSIITLPPKSLPGVLPTELTSAQFNEMERKRVSVYTDIGGLPSLLGGYTARAGVWADAQWWLLWLKTEMEKSIFEAMRTSNRLSNAVLKDTINSVMAKAVTSGGAQPGGRVSNSIKHDIQRTTGNYAFDGVMNTGYILWIDPPQSQTDADRNARISRFKIWVAPSEAIHTVASAIILSG